VKFLWPEALWLLLAMPLLLAGYVMALRRTRKATARYAGLAAPGETRTAQGFIRHIPAALFFVALTVMILAVARPAALISLPSQDKTLILAIDVSGSMRATDVKPNRLAAAQAAARTFVEEQPRSTRIGVVAFAASAAVVQHPTQNRDDILAALERLQVQRGTALGSSIVVALAAIFPGQGITPESVQAAAAARKSPQAKAALDTEKKGPEPAGPASHKSAAIIVLTDGQANSGVPPADAARAAAERGVRLFAIGIGTPAGETMTVDGWRARVRLDEETLKDIANTTQGQYFHAGDAKELKKIYKALNSRFVIEKKETEITAVLAGVAALLAAVSALLSLLWFNRIL
jgi:Ca-activated chloride channel family protein